MEHPSYYSIITADVRYDKRLKPNEKLLFSEITALSNKRGYCNASNNYFAQLYDVNAVTASNWVNHLKDRGYIDVEMIYDGKRIKERRIFVNSNPIKKNFKGGINEKIKGGINKKVNENNTSINNTSKNNQPEEDFEKLWKLYPRKEGKKKAFEVYKRAIKNGTTNKEIQTGIVNYLTQIRVQRTNKQYIKQGSTWFNGECWNDEYNVGQERSPVNPKTVPSSAPAERTVADLEREQRESRRDAFPMQYKNHPEWFTEETIKNILEEFPELREKVAEIDRARATSDSNTA